MTDDLLAKIIAAPCLVWLGWEITWAFADAIGRMP